MSKKTKDAESGPPKPDTQESDTRKRRKKKPPANNPASKRMLAAAKKQAKALELRRAGYSFDEIAVQCGYKDKGGAHKAVLAGLQKTLQEPADDLRTLELARLDALLNALWPQAQGGKMPDGRTLPPNFYAIDRVLKIQERRAALTGLDAAVKVDQRIDVTKLSDEELDALVQSKKR